jgi:dihydrofolate reductase
VAKLVFAMNQSLDGYVDHDRFAPGPDLFRHFIGRVASVTGSLYGRKLYEIMRYWDEDRPEWSGAEREFAAAWRGMPKWVVSRRLAEVGPNATLIEGDVESAVRRLKADHDGQIDVGGPDLAASLTDLGLIDAYQIYLHPVVLGSGTPFFSRPRPPLRLTETEDMAGGVLRLSYVPA